MLLVQEDPKNLTDFTLFLSALDQVIVANTENDTFQQLKIPEPPIAENLTKGQIEVIKRENRNITWIEISKDKQYIAIITENKQLVIFDKTYQVLKNIVLQRVSSKISFSSTNDILVADRTGDVYLYKMADEKNEPILLLGHLSVILDMLVTDCGNYIITCDRDEKIRVSHYPNTYNVATFCLGHTEFVTSLKLLKTNNILLSGSGDGTIRMWNYLEGKQVNMIDTKILVDEKTLEKFASQMDSEKVDVTVVPITDIQVHEEDSKVKLAVSLYSVAKVFLYGFDTNTLQYSHLDTIDLDTVMFSFCLCSRLYVLSKKLNIFEFVNSKYSAIIAYQKFEDKLLEYKDLIVSDNSDITLLYKRKFDNVQEYLERKKLRLEAK